MNFECQKELTLDNSVPIIVRGEEDEYIFQFALNREEIKDLQRELNKALKKVSYKR